MIKTLIVEDEFLVRLGLKTAIDWQSHGFEIVGEATNGLDGFTMFLNYRPKLILTDIKMPKMDGVSLMKKIRAIDENVKFIVLTAYTDFAYTKAAIELGVVTYLLKGSLLNNELEDTLDHLAPKLANPADTTSSQDPKASEITMEAAEKLKMTVTELSFSSDPSEYIYATCLRMPGTRNADSFSTFRTLCFSILAEKHIPFRRIADDEYVYLIVKSGNTPRADMKYLCDSVSRYLGREIFCGFSVIHNPSDFVFEHIAFAGAACESNIFLYEDHIQEYKAPLSNVSEKIDNALPLLENSVLKRDLPACMKTLRQIMEEIHRLCSVKLLNRTLYRLILMFIKYDETIDETEALKNLIELDRIDLISMRLEKMLKDLCASTSPLLPRRKVYVEQAKHFIQMHLNENIKLYNVSEYVHVSPNYLGKLFFEEMGIYLNDYIANEKIAASCKLLRETNLSISNIADKVGMNDQQYFSKLFKKEMGCTPKAYIQKWRQ